MAALFAVAGTWDVPNFSPQQGGTPEQQIIPFLTQKCGNVPYAEMHQVSAAWGVSAANNMYYHLLVPYNQQWSAWSPGTPGQQAPLTVAGQPQNVVNRHAWVDLSALKMETSFPELATWVGVAVQQVEPMVSTQYQTHYQKAPGQIANVTPRGSPLNSPQ